MGFTIPRKTLITSIVGTSLGVAFLIKDKFSGRKYTYQTDAAKNKVIIITGASTGLGKAVAKDLIFRKATVILACRDMEKCENAKFFISLYHKVNRVECMECDLSSQKSIREFVNNFTKSNRLFLSVINMTQWWIDSADSIFTEYKRLNVLINNAGVFGVPRTVTEEGIELHLGVNHMGHFLLTNLLLPTLKKSAPSRIVNVTSLDFKKCSIDKQDLNMTKNYESRKAYQRSKLANILFTKQLAKQLEGSGVTANAVYPGVVNTDLLRHSSFHNSYFSTIFLKPILWMFIKNPHRGAQPIIYAAIDPDLVDVSGYLIESNFIKNPLDILVPDEENIVPWLWAVSEKWTRPSLVESS